MEGMAALALGRFSFDSIAHCTSVKVVLFSSILSLFFFVSFSPVGWVSAWKGRVTLHPVYLGRAVIPSITETCLGQSWRLHVVIPFFCFVQRLRMYTCALMPPLCMQNLFLASYHGVSFEKLMEGIAAPAFGRFGLIVLHTELIDSTTPEQMYQQIISIERLQSCLHVLFKTCFLVFFCRMGR